MGRGLWYVLDDDERPVPVREPWAACYDREAHRIGRTRTPFGEVSTIFLGLDHSHDGGPPVLWESMVFGGLLDNEMDRYRSAEEARAGHRRMVRRVWLSPLLLPVRALREVWRITLRAFGGW